MKTNSNGSSEPNKNTSSKGETQAQNPNDPTKRENPEKNDPTRKEPGHPDHTEPKPHKNDPTRIDPEWNDPEKIDPTENSAEPSTGGKGQRPAEQKESDNSNYKGGDYSHKDKSAEKNYTGTSAGFMSEEDEDKNDMNK
jgi:hypothetical protein